MITFQMKTSEIQELSFPKRYSKAKELGATRLQLECKMKEPEKLLSSYTDDIAIE